MLEKNSSSSPKFSSWHLLFLAVRDFNEYRKKEGKEPIYTLSCRNLGVRTAGEIWQLQKISPEIDEAWAAFCSDPEQDVKFNA